MKLWYCRTHGLHTDIARWDGSTRKHKIFFHKHKGAHNTCILSGHQDTSSFLRGNEMAHATSRELTHLARCAEGEQTGLSSASKGDGEDEAVHIKFSDITVHHRLGRRCYLRRPHLKLSKEDEITWRRPQTNTCPHGTILSAMYLASYHSTCKFCDELATNAMATNVISWRLLHRQHLDSKGP
ncbi:hypothetical protein HPB50_011439 [Hyalomma asiaticum]|uniref:Uncharacterized protein n=1 Tax=Hyalomma asiaticum TaxID=266040 RepID=A0ACB7SRZ7_HYAAI|nr:hypothetical protein HPB50_011439 [Hyalomma asiaticum]